MKVNGYEVHLTRTRKWWGSRIYLAGCWGGFLGGSGTNRLTKVSHAGAFESVPSGVRFEGRDATAKLVRWHIEKGHIALRTDAAGLYTTWATTEAHKEWMARCHAEHDAQLRAAREVA